MKTLFLLIILICILNNASAQCDSMPISIHVKIEKEYIRTFSKDVGSIAQEIKRNYLSVRSDSVNQKFFDFSLKLKNTSTKKIKIYLMSCSWTDNLIVNNNYIFIKGINCDINSEDLVEFEPGETKVYTHTLAKSIKFDYPCKGCNFGFDEPITTKLGLVVINDIFTGELAGSSYFKSLGDKSLWKIVWSNPLYLLTNQEAHSKPISIPVNKNDSQN